MQDWFTAQAAEGFPAFAGAVVSGAIPLQEALLNELIAGWLAHAAVSQRPAGGPALARLIRSARVEASAGVVTLHFEIRV